MIQTLKTLLTIPLFAVLAMGQQAASTPTAKSASPEASLSLSGKQVFAANCALCHGTDAKGGGPFSPQLKVWPPDLTLLARKNSGTFPALHVAEIIDGESEQPAHGSHEMPVWGPVFRSRAHGRQDSAQRRINSLVKYLESLQQK